MPLTKAEIDKRMIELRNLRKLYKGAKERIAIQNKTIKELKARVRELEANDKEKDQRITDLSLQIDRKSTRLNSSHIPLSRMPSSA